MRFRARLKVAEHDTRMKAFANPQLLEGPELPRAALRPCNAMRKQQVTKVANMTGKEGIARGQAEKTG
jgi:hypothetical protein